MAPSGQALFVTPYRIDTTSDDNVTFLVKIKTNEQGKELNLTHTPDY
jgi:hypothetical protein